MRICLARPPQIAVMGVLLALSTLLCGAADRDPVQQARDAAEREACKQNLATIYKAIEAHRREKLDLPMWLSSLVPKYLPDVNVLVCPVCRRTGAIEPPPLSDPKIPSSYLYELCPVQLGDLNPKDPSRTRREWKRRQMGLLGSAVPLVRCRHHEPTLNLSFDGRVYEAPMNWELAFTNMAPLAALTASNLFAGDPIRGRGRFPARSPKATPKQLDLTKFYNATLSENWLGKTNENFSSLPYGLRVIEGVTFDVRGLVQLSGKGLNKRFPAKISGLPVGLKCKRLHFLHALAGWSSGDAGTAAGAYVIKFAGNDARVQIPLTCGTDVGSWRSGEGGEEPSAAWTAPAQEGDARTRTRPRLFLTSWTNLAPDVQIESIEVISDATRGGIVLAAISAE